MILTIAGVQKKTSRNSRGYIVLITGPSQEAAHEGLEKKLLK